MNDYGTEVEGLPGPALLNLTESCGKAPYSFEQKGGAPVSYTWLALAWVLGFAYRVCGGGVPPIRPPPPVSWRA